MLAPVDMLQQTTAGFYPLLLLQVASDAYSVAFLCPLSFGDNSSLLVRGGAAFLPPLSAYEVTW